MKIFKRKSFLNILPFLLSIASLVFGFGFNFIMARVLGASVFGELQYLVSLATTISSLFVFGLTWFIVREAKNERHKGLLMSKVYTIFFFIVAFLSPVAFYILFKLSPELNNDLVKAFSILVVGVIMGANALGSAYFQGIGKYHKSICIDSIIPKAIMFVLTLIFLCIGWLDGFSDNYLIFYAIVYGLISIYMFKKFFKKFSLDLTKKEYLSISFFFGVTITYSLTSNLTKVFQGAFFDDPSVLGIISTSLTIIGLLSVVTSVVTKMVQPVFAKLNREKKYDELLETYRMSTRLCLYVGIPFYLFMLTQGDRFLIWFGESYLQYPSIIVILTLVSMASELSGPTGTMLSMTGKEKIELINGIINLSSFSIFCLIFSRNKVYGFVFALMCSTLLTNIVKYIEVWYLYKKMPLDFKTILGFIIIAIVNFSSIFFLKYIDNYWIWFVVSVLVGVSLIAINFILGLHKSDFKKFIHLKI